MARKTSKIAVLSLDDIADFKPAQTADAVAERHQTRTRAYLEMGKLIFHLEERCTLARSQNIYGMLQSRGVPKGSIDNGRRAATFIKEVVIPGHLSEARLDEVLTNRIATQAGKLLKGTAESGRKMTAEEIAGLLSQGAPAALGEELDCLVEHGLTIADKEAADKEALEAAAREKAEAAAAAQREAEEQAAAAAADAAAAAAGDDQAEPEAEPSTDDEADSDHEAEPSTGDDAEDDEAEPDPSVATRDAEDEAEPSAEDDEAEDDAEDEAETAEDGTAPTIVDGTRSDDRGNTPPPAPKPLAPQPVGTSLADVIELIEEAELASYDLSPGDLAAVKEKIEAWVATMAETLESARELAAA